MIISINKKSYPNTMIVIMDQDDGRSSFIEKQDVTEVLNDQNHVIGYNFFNIDKYLDYKDMPNGEVKLDSNQIEILNSIIKKTGFDTVLQTPKPTLVYGYVATCQPHPDSDHLKITTVDVGIGSNVQIVCGAPNIAQGQKVVVALNGTLMPNGVQIWNGELRGVESDGMICSARELSLKHAPQKRGIMVLPESFEIGTPFDAKKCDQLIVEGKITL